VWVFVLHPNTDTPPHRHPNSVQYTAVVAGRGAVTIEGERSDLESFELSRPSTVCAISKNAAHGFHVGTDPLVVISFHTAAADALVEVEVEGGGTRRYVEGASAVDDGTAHGSLSNLAGGAP
jgi:quercetin dioxygenase-like cupin family protein